MAKKICVVTGTRAEYGLLYWTLKGLMDKPGFSLYLVVTGMHLAPEFGMTCERIEADGFRIDRKVDILLASDSGVGMAKSMGLGLIGFSEVYRECNPDLLFIVGDRFEMFAAAAAAMACNIPIAHCHGGETTQGAIDEAMRHAITKMSHLHFTSTEEYRRRVIQLGEAEDRVFNVGALGIESIHRLPLLEKTTLEYELGFSFNGKFNALVTFHPATLERDSENQFLEVMEALRDMPGGKVIFTKANADPSGRAINALIDREVAKNPDWTAYASLGQLRYLSCLRFVDVVIGNSSSGLIEVPSFHKATIDIGDRQKGRIRGGSVIHCSPAREEIQGALHLALSSGFQERLRDEVNPYDAGNASERILSVLSEVDLGNLLVKRFNDW
jgi:GDP/UDP-N,N'-diacetylbacillosamine 2-epimerase (hydrolysing)